MSELQEIEIAKTSHITSENLRSSNADMNSMRSIFVRPRGSDQIIDFGASDPYSESKVLIAQVQSEAKQDTATIGKHIANKEGIAQDNPEFLLQYLSGHGNNVQEHFDLKHDLVLQDFTRSPGAQAIREEYDKLGDPAYTDKLSYGTLRAFNETVVAKFFDVVAPPASALMDEVHPLPDNALFDHDHWGNVGLQIGGFGNPPKDQPWARATAHRCDENGNSKNDGNYVQFQVVNVAGFHSFGYHWFPDLPTTYNGPMRNITQVFRWTEPINEQSGTEH